MVRPSLSIATIVSNAIRLNYPITAVLESVEPIADEVIVNVDANSVDRTPLLMEAACRRLTGRGHFQWFPSAWDWTVHDAGGEFRRQTDLTFEKCHGDWILYLQADEIIHEEDHDLIRDLMSLPEDYAGVSFIRLCFWRDLKTLRTDWTLPLTRMFRRGRGRSAGDSMNCAVDGLVWPTDEGLPRIFHYSRVGTAEEIGRRIYANDIMHHAENELDPQHTYDFELREVDGHLKGRDARLPRKDPGAVLKSYTDTHPRVVQQVF